MANLYINALDLGRMVDFPAFVTSFSDSYKASYTNEELPYNLDPYRAFTATTRNISISFDIIAENKNQSIENLRKVSELSSYVFAIKTQSSITKPTGLRIFYANLLRDPYIQFDGSNHGDAGLSCLLLSYDVKPEYESGFFINGGKEEAIFPKLIKLNLQLAPKHYTDIRPEVMVGTAGSTITQNYPYYIRKVVAPAGAPTNAPSSLAAPAPGPQSGGDAANAAAAATANAAAEAAAKGHYTPGPPPVAGQSPAAEKPPAPAGSSDSTGGSVPNPAP